MKNGVYFIVIARLVAELFKVTWRLFCIELKLCTVVALTTKFHDICTVTFPWQHNGLQALFIQKIKSEFSPSRSVIYSCCLFSGKVELLMLHCKCCSTAIDTISGGADVLKTITSHDIPTITIIVILLAKRCGHTLEWRTIERQAIAKQNKHNKDSTIKSWNDARRIIGRVVLLP